MAAQLIPITQSVVELKSATPIWPSNAKPNIP